MGAPTELTSILAELRTRISRVPPLGMNEENTKGTLIEPLLRVLGWTPEDIDQVQREYKVKPGDRPVDYALMTLRTPRMFIEAKAIGHNLSDRRWASQVMAYASVAGIEWIVLTDGNEYRIYNSHAPVDVEEKLFRKVRITDTDPVVEETLLLLAKDRLEENRIDVLWRAQFVDRQVKQAIEQLFSAESDLLLVNYVEGRTKHLTTQEIRESLARCKVHLDFPVLTDDQLAAKARAEGRTAGTAAQETETSREAIEAPRGKTWPGGKTWFGVSLHQLVHAGLVRPPLELFRNYRGQHLRARIEADGGVTFQGSRFPSLSTAAGTARATVIGKRKGGTDPATNGWAFWRFLDAAGKEQAIDVLRQRYLEGGQDSLLEGQGT